MSSFLELELTNCCNLNCEYCYEKPYLCSITHKDAKILEYFEAKNKILKYIEKESNVPCSVELFGGEPLLAKETIKKLLQDEELNKIVKYSIITNSTIYDEELAKLFIKNNVSIEFSIDPPRLHSKYRIYRQSVIPADSYEKCWSTFLKWLDIFKKYSFKNIRVRTTYYKPEFKDELIQFVLFLLANDISIFINNAVDNDEYAKLYWHFKNVRINLNNINWETSRRICPLECFDCYNPTCPNSNISELDVLPTTKRYNTGVIDDDENFKKVTMSNTGSRFD